MTCFERLGLPNDRKHSEDDIKKAYRTLAKIHHPDKGGKEEDFKEITAAYEAALHAIATPMPSIEESFWEAFRNFRKAATKPFCPEDGMVRVQLVTNIAEIKAGKDFEIMYRKSYPCPETACDRKPSCKSCEGDGYVNVTEKITASLAFKNWEKMS